LGIVVLGCVAVFMFASEIWVNRVVFVSEHNWFHI